MSSEECGRSTTPASHRSLGPQGANAQPVWVLHLAQLGHSANCALQTHLTTEPGQLQDPALGTFAGKDSCPAWIFPQRKRPFLLPPRHFFLSQAPGDRICLRGPSFQSAAGRLLGTASRVSELSLLRRRTGPGGQVFSSIFRATRPFSSPPRCEDKPSSRRMSG